MEGGRWAAKAPARPAWAFVVLAGHAALLLAVMAWRPPVRPAGGAEASRWVTVQLKRAPRPADAADRARLAPIRMVPASPPPSAAPVIAGESAAAADAASGLDNGTPGAVAGTPAGRPSGSSGSSGSSGAAGALNLRPSREAMLGGLAHPATQDPRSNSPRPTFEEKIAIGADPTLCVWQERLPDGSVRRAMGRLVEVAPAIERSTGYKGKAVTVCTPPPLGDTRV